MVKHDIDPHFVTLPPLWRHHDSTQPQINKIFRERAWHSGRARKGIKYHKSGINRPDALAGITIPFVYNHMCTLISA